MTPPPPDMEVFAQQHLPKETFEQRYQRFLRKLDEQNPAGAIHPTPGYDPKAPRFKQIPVPVQPPVRAVQPVPEPKLKLYPRECYGGGGPYLRANWAPPGDPEERQAYYYYQYSFSETEFRREMSRPWKRY